MAPLISRSKRNDGPWLIVFAYHGVTKEVNVEKLSHGLHILKDDFERHCRIIASNFKTSHVDDFFQQIPKNKERVFALLSFDDIYQNVVTTALPLLEEYRLKFTVFPATDYVGSREPFWWDKVRLAFLATPFHQLHIGKHSFDLSTSQARQQSMFTFEAHLAGLDKERREVLVTELYTKNQDYVHLVFGKIIEEFRPVDRESLEKLKNHPLCQVGLHSASHSALPSLSPRQVEQDLRASQDWYQELFHKRAQDMCYPFGVSTQQIDEICQQLGFRRGFILNPRDPARIQWSANSDYPYLLVNRYQLHPHDDSDSIVGKGAGFYDPWLRFFGTDWL